MNESDLSQYLNNHLAGSVAGIELVKKTAAENRGTGLGSYMERLLKELEEDQDTVRRLLKAMGRTENRVKEAGAWALEKLAFSPLSGLADSSSLRPLMEVEGILLGTMGRRGMWILLERFYRGDARLAIADFGLLRQRAERQAEELERFREEAAAAAFLK